jgi:hypothetical protein
MTVLVPCTPQPTAPFQFQPVLDGVSYNAVCPFNAYGQRYYLNIYNVQGVLELSIPLIASPDTGDIDLAKGYFDTPIIFRDSSQTFEIG